MRGRTKKDLLKRATKSKIKDMPIIRKKNMVKCGFCKKLLLEEWNGDQLPTFFICSSLLGGWNSKSTAKQQKTHPKVMTEWKKWATGQSCIRKEGTSYKIHTLVASLLSFLLSRHHEMSLPHISLHYLPHLTRCHLTRKKSSVSIDFSCQIILLQRSSSYLLSHDIAWLDQQLQSAINSLTFTVTYYRKLKRFLRENSASKHF